MTIMISSCVSLGGSRFLCPQLEKVGGAYCFRVVHPSLHASHFFVHSITFKLCMLGRVRASSRHCRQMQRIITLAQKILILQVVKKNRLRKFLSCFGMSPLAKSH